MESSQNSQNSISEKWTLHKIQYEENGLFTKINMRKTDSPQNSVSKKTDSLQNLIAFMFHVFRRMPQLALFLKVTNASRSLLEVKN